MTTATISSITMPYSLERMRTMDRANRIGRILFNAKRRGNALTVSQAAKIVDAEIDQANIPAKAVAIVKSSAAATLARVVRTTKIARLMFAGLTAAKAVAVVDAGKTEAGSFAGAQTAANDSKAGSLFVYKAFKKLAQGLASVANQLIIASQWLNKQGAAL